jgi:Spy/CpxP family protein refolding chaperone
VRRVRRAAALAAALATVASTAACSDDDGGGTAAELCALVADGRHANLFAEGFDPTDRARALAQLRAAEVDLDELLAAAPGDLRAAIDDEIRYVEALLEAVEGTDPDDPAAVVSAVNALDEEREAAEVAALDLAAFQAEQCGRSATTVTP